MRRLGPRGLDSYDGRSYKVARVNQLTNWKDDLHVILGRVTVWCRANRDVVSRAKGRAISCDPNVMKERVISVNLFCDDTHDGASNAILNQMKTR